MPLRALMVDHRLHTITRARQFHHRDAPTLSWTPHHGQVARLHSVSVCVVGYRVHAEVLYPQSHPKQAAMCRVGPVVQRRGRHTNRWSIELDANPVQMLRNVGQQGGGGGLGVAAFTWRRSVIYRSRCGVGLWWVPATARCIGGEKHRLQYRGANKVLGRPTCGDCQPAAGNQGSTAEY